MTTILKKKVNKKKRPTQTYVIDCTKPVQDGIMQIDQLETFLEQNIKVEGLKGKYLKFYLC